MVQNLTFHLLLDLEQTLISTDTPIQMTMLWQNQLLYQGEQFILQVQITKKTARILKHITHSFCPKEK